MAFGVLLDTLVVRSVLVTALNLDIGKTMWWPSALSKQAEPEPAEEQVAGSGRLSATREMPGSSVDPGISG